MESIVTRFVAELRKEGLRVSPGESLDAVCALAHGGLEGRGSVRSLLRLTLVKSVHDIPTFNQVFNRFFQRQFPDGLEVAAEDLLDEALIIMEGEAMLGTNPEMVNENMTLANVDAQFDRDDLKDLSALREIPLDDLDGTEMEIQLKGYHGTMQAPRPSMRMSEPPVSYGFKPALHGQTRDISFSREEIEAMEDAVSKMILRLKKDIRRVKNRENRGKIHVIRTIQRNYRSGMVPFLLELRRRRKEKPRLVVFCDVSFSVSHASKFMLLLLHTLHNRIMDVRSFVFNEDLAEITEMLSNSPINTMMEAIDSGKIVDLDANTNYGKVLLTFKDKFLDNLRGKPAVIFLGDARNNYHKSNDWVLERVREKVGYMLWLTPEEKTLWKRGDCLIETYGRYCDNVEFVKNVEELNDIVEDLFRNIYLEADHLAKRSFAKEEEEQEYNYWDYYKRGVEDYKQEFDGSGRSHW
ncbi:MAG: VWA domain-containing protein [Desulfuromonadaceae bacterium]